MVNFNAWPYPRHVAHRGAGKLAPENTIAALKLGASYGYRMFEFDVKLSADSQPFLLHDSTLNRTTNGQGIAGQLTWDALSRLDAGSWHSAAFAGERIPLLSEVAAWAIDANVMVNIEIKPTPGQEEETGRIVAIEAARLWAGAASVPPLLSSFAPAALEAALAARPELPRALLVEQMPNDWLRQCQALACVAIDGNWRSINAEFIAQAHAHNMRVLSYTVNDMAKAKEMLDAGLDGLITDAVDLIQP